MDKKQFAEYVINEVRALPVTSVLSTRMELIERYGVAKGLCPFHNDTHIGSFVVTDKKGIWKCFACGAGGDSSKFVSLLEGSNYLESAFKIALEFNIISSEEYEEYYARRRFSKDLIKRIEKKYTELDKKKFEHDIASDEILDKVFRLFIEECNLSETHQKHLKEERHLSDTEIKEGLYFTFPTNRKMASFRLKLEKAFPNEGVDILKNVPGFFKRKSDGLWSFTYHKGIGIGIKNAKGQVVGIQIRHDEKNSEKQSRYVWFSSSFASLDKENFEYGTSSGSPVDVVYPEKITNAYVYITEGRFKAQLLAKKMGSVVLSVQGVCSWRGIANELENLVNSNVLYERLTENLKGKPFKVKSLLVAFDADLNYKVQVFEQLRKMTDALESIDDFKYPVYYLNWNEELGKGIDDVFINQNEKGIRRYDKQKWDKHYQLMIEDILKKEPYENIKKVPAEIVKKYFYQHFTDFPPLTNGALSEKHKRHYLKMRKQHVC